MNEKQKTKISFYILIIAISFTMGCISGGNTPNWGNDSIINLPIDFID